MTSSDSHEADRLLATLARFLSGQRGRPLEIGSLSEESGLQRSQILVVLNDLLRSGLCRATPAHRLYLTAVGSARVAVLEKSRNASCGLERAGS